MRGSHHSIPWYPLVFVHNELKGVAASVLILLDVCAAQHTQPRPAKESLAPVTGGILAIQMQQHRVAMVSVVVKCTANAVDGIHHVASKPAHGTGITFKLRNGWRSARCIAMQRQSQIEKHEVTSNIQK